MDFHGNSSSFHAPATAGSNYPRRVLTGIALNTAIHEARLVVAAARAAEDAGFDSVRCYDHLSGAVLGGDGCLDVWSTVAAIAVSTQRVTVGPLVINTTTHHPAHIAVAAATVQSLSAGRLELGLGAGASRPSSFAAEMEMFALPEETAQRRRLRIAETIGFLRALWGGATSFEGEWATFRDVTGVSIPSPKCPIIVGANGPRMAELAGRLADGVNFHTWEPDLAGLIRRARDAASKAGKEQFMVSVEAPFESEWLDADSPARAALAAAGAAEVIVRWNATMGPAPVRSAARWLH